MRWPTERLMTRRDGRIIGEGEVGQRRVRKTQGSPRALGGSYGRISSTL